jgi:polar amino acid transport system substrate-binding protein
MLSGLGAARRGFVRATVLIALLFGMLVVASPTAGADQCSPPGEQGASALPTNLAAAAAGPREDKYTTATTEPWAAVKSDALQLITPGTLTVGTLSDAPPSVCINSAGQFTGFDNELLRAIAGKIGLQIKFVGTDFSGLLAQVAGRRFDAGSSSITTTEARRRTVGFTNGYDFGYFSLVVPSGSSITGFGELRAGQRIGVVQGTVQEAYVVDTLGLQPVKFPDYNTVYASLKSRQIDAWVAPSQQAQGTVRPGDPAEIIENTFSLDNFVAYAVAQENTPLIDALNAGLDAVIADGTWSRLYSDWVPRALPPGWKPGSKAAPLPQLPDFGAIAAGQQKAGPAPVVNKSVWTQLRESFLDWSLYKKAIPDLLKTGLPNTLILTFCASVIGLLLGLALAVAGISRSAWLRVPARIYTDLFRGLPEVVIILIIGLGIGPIVGGFTGNNPYPLGIAALGLMAAAYIGEILRSGVQSVEAGQLEASRALGFSYASSMRLVVIPQGVRRVLPALMNQFISLLKASSLVYFLGLVASQRELFQVGRDLNAQTGNLSPLVAAGLFYLALTVPLTHLVNRIDHRLRHGRPAEKEDTLAPAATGQEMI